MFKLISIVCLRMKLLHIVLICIAMFFIINSSFCEDEIETLDGSLFKGKIVKEDNKSVYLKIRTGTVLIDRDMIKAVRMEERWGIEDHVERIGEVLDNDADPLEEQPQQSIIYFPLTLGSWWKYKVNYTPRTLYGDALPDAGETYELKWEITDQTRTETRYFDQYAWHLPDIYQLSVTRKDSSRAPIKKMLFVGSLEGDADKAFLVMLDQEQRDRFFYQRVLPKNPFLKYTRQWTDIGQENKATFKVVSKIVGIEGIDTTSGYFEDCLVVESTQEVENQKLESKVYCWYSPEVGMVKMVQEIICPQNETDTQEKTFIFQEYDLIDYGVK